MKRVVLSRNDGLKALREGVWNCSQDREKGVPERCFTLLGRELTVLSNPGAIQGERALFSSGFPVILLFRDVIPVQILDVQPPNGAFLVKTGEKGAEAVLFLRINNNQQ